MKGGRGKDYHSWWLWTVHRTFGFAVDQGRLTTNAIGFSALNGAFTPANQFIWNWLELRVLDKEDRQDLESLRGTIKLYQERLKYGFGWTDKHVKDCLEWLDYEEKEWKAYIKKSFQTFIPDLCAVLNLDDEAKEHSPEIGEDGNPLPSRVPDQIICDHDLNQIALVCASKCRGREVGLSGVPLETISIPYPV